MGRTVFQVLTILLAITVLSCGIQSAGSPDRSQVNPPDTLLLHNEPSSQGEVHSSAGLMPAESFTTSNPALDLFLVEHNGDDKPDLAAPLLGGGLSLLINQTTGNKANFNIETPTMQDLQILSVCTADLNADSLPEMAVMYGDAVNPDGNRLLSLLSLQPSGSYVNFGEIRLNNTSPYIVFDCINSDDSISDVIALNNKWHNIVGFYIRDGLQLHNNTTIPVAGMSGDIEPNYGSMVVSDIEGGGLNDILVVDNANSHIFAHMHLEGDYPLTIYNPNSLKNEPIPQNYFNPLYTTDYSSTIYSSFSTGYSAKRLAVEDLNSDGIKDVAVLLHAPSEQTLTNPIFLQAVSAKLIPGYSACIYETIIDGTSGFESEPGADRSITGQLRAVLSFPGTMTDIHLADLNHDGITDLVGCVEGGALGPGNDYIYYFPGLGNFQFDDPIAFPLSSAPIRMHLADLNGDDFLDVAVLLPMQNGIDIRLNDCSTGIGEQGITYAISDSINAS